MNDSGQFQQLRNTVCECRGGQCYGNASTGDSAVTISPRHGSCSRQKLAIYNHRQTSVTSQDSGLSLDPITEHHGCGEADTEDNFTRSSQTMVSETCKSQRHKCARALDEIPSDESDLIIKSACEHHPLYATEKLVPVFGSRGSEPYAIGRPHISRNGRVRTRSESCVGDNIVNPVRNHSNFTSSCGNCHPQHHYSTAFNAVDEFQQKETCHSKEIRLLRRRYRLLFCFTAVVFIISCVSIGVIIVGKSDLDSKIIELQGSISSPQTSTIPPVGRVQLAAKNKPHIHLQLNGSRRLHATRWNGKVLSWLADVSPPDALRYNGNTNTITVTEAGSYFVYNQIYIAREIHRKERGMGNLSNQTVTHTIYKIPFNYPAAQKPRIVAESVLTHCWDKDATTQIHASYLGIVVNMRQNEQLLIAVESFRESVDRLLPMNTFFGMFKL